MATAILPGTVLWVCLGPRGDYKERPAIALSEPDGNGNLTIIAGTTQVSRTDANCTVELPWAPTRHPLTKLKKKTVVVVNWIEQIHIASIKQVAGRLPARTLADIQTKIREFSANPRERN